MRSPLALLRSITAIVLVIAVPLLVSSAPPASARGTKETIVTVYHQPVTPILVQGSGLGAVRTFFAPIAVNGKPGDGYYFVGTLTTVTVGFGPDNEEIRQSNLDFVFGSEANQIVLGGISLYPAAGATLPPGTQTIRPILGGSGTYAGARGYALSTNLGANGWTHVFHLLPN